jgi:ATP-dependent Lon protease
MAESGRLALSYLRSKAGDYGIDLAKLQQSDLHLHFPAGAIQKDGPSAGIAIACAFLGFLTGRPAPSDLAMTGELTLVGEVLPIGGVREKVLAAKTFGLRRVLLPEGNRADVAEMRPELVAGLEFHYAENFADVFDVVFGTAATKARAPARSAVRAAINR